MFSEAETNAQINTASLRNTREILDKPPVSPAAGPGRRSCLVKYASRFSELEANLAFPAEDFPLSFYAFDSLYFHLCYVLFLRIKKEEEKTPLWTETIRMSVRKLQPNSGLNLVSAPLVCRCPLMPPDWRLMLNFHLSTKVSFEGRSWRAQLFHPAGSDFEMDTADSAVSPAQNNEWFY